MPGFESPNFTQTPNDLLEVMLPDMGLAELKVTLAIVRLTYGYHRERTRCSISELMRMTGLSRQGVFDGANAAIGRGTLTRLKSDGRSTRWEICERTPLALPEVKPHRGAEVKFAPVTSRALKKDTKKEKTVLREREQSSSGPSLQQQWVELLSNVCSIDPSLNGGRLAKRGMALQKAGYTLAQVEAGYSKGGWWYRSDWRGRQGQPPKPEDILATIKQATSESAFMPATEDGRLAAVAQPEQSSRDVAFEDGQMIPMGSDR